MEIEIREIEVEDYRELLDFMKKVKGETNFLLGYPDEVKLSYEDEKEHIKKVKSFETSKDVYKRQEQALKTDEILYGILLSTQLRKKIRKKIKKKVEEYYENNGN